VYALDSTGLKGLPRQLAEAQLAAEPLWHLFEVTQQLAPQLDVDGRVASSFPTRGLGFQNCLTVGPHGRNPLARVGRKEEYRLVSSRVRENEAGIQSDVSAQKFETPRFDPRPRPEDRRGE
jgi:hypothetical protein